jgi:hypothetical protein
LLVASRLFGRPHLSLISLSGCMSPHEGLKVGDAIGWPGASLQRSDTPARCLHPVKSGAAVMQGNGGDAKAADDAKRKVAPELCWTAERVAADLKLSRRASDPTVASSLTRQRVLASRNLNGPRALRISIAVKRTRQHLRHVSPAIQRSFCTESPCQQCCICVQRRSCIRCEHAIGTARPAHAV